MSDENHAIKIEVETAYLASESTPEQNNYVFTYTITIHNEGLKSARLMRRHWIITDGNGQIQEVKGDGVVGEQPYLQPGEGFRYTSGTVLKTSFGTMKGTYEMVDDDGEPFDAIIPEFFLSIPRTLH